MRLFKMKSTSLQIKQIRIVALLLLIGVIYAFIVRYTSFCIPCFFNVITGLKCPGCGITHLFLSLMNFDIPSAFYANPYLFITSPIILLLVILNFFCADSIKNKPIIKRLTIVYLISLIFWTIIRNIIHM